MTARFGADGCTCRPFTARTNPPRYLQPGEPVDQTTSWQQDRACMHHGEQAAMGAPELTAQDALAFVEECCTIADRESRSITTADVREWLKGERCGRQLLADHDNRIAKESQ